MEANVKEVKKDCFAYNDEKTECKALKDLNCTDCKFYKVKKSIGQSPEREENK
jgi:hypothetical protein